MSAPALHRLLLRQLKKVGIRDPSEEPPPTAEGWAELLARINRFYRSTDEMRYTLERSLEISSREMMVLHGEIATERDRIATVIEALSSGVFQVDTAWTVAFHNSAALELLGLTDVGPSSLIGRPFFEEIQVTTAAGSVLDPAAMTLALSRRHSLEEHDAEITCPDGTSFPAHIRFNPLRRDDEMVGCVVAITDLTVQKRAEKEVREARVEAEVARRAERSRGMFLANMSHELRTPLNAIIGYGEMLAEEARDSRASTVSDLERILSAGRHLLHLINDILDLSKIDSGKMELHLESFEVSRLIDDTVAGTRPLVSARGNKFEVRVSPGTGFMHTDMTRLRQCLYNLVSNAAKFTDGGHITLTVTPHEDRWLRFQVADSGIGIAPDRLDQLFDAFTQADASTTKLYGGTGLGLTLVRAFCEMMGGTVSVESTEGQGSTFELFLPRDAARRPVPGPADRHVWTAGEGGEVVLVVDDDAAVFDLVGRWLSREGLRIVGVSTAEQALPMALKILPSVILLDLLLPGEDGWSALAALKEDPRTVDTPVVIISTVDGAQRTAWDMQAAGYITKPLRRARVLEVVRRHLLAGVASPVK